MSYTDDERKKKLGTILRKIHHLIPPIDIDTYAIGDYEIRKGFFDGQEIKRLIVYLRSTGCQWMLDDENGGCTMCGHLAGTTRGRKITTDEYKKQFETIISQIDFKDIPTICVYNAGSFFNDNEISPEARKNIYDMINKIPEIKHVVFETRPEYITEEKIQVLTNSIIGRCIEIGMGLESSNEYVRQMCLNKGLKLFDFQNAIKLLKKYNVKILSYVLLKPPFLGEGEAIKDSVNTIAWAFEQGIDVISLEPISVQKNTLIHLLYSMGDFRPPWAWSVLNVILQSHDLGHVRIGGFEFFPPPEVCTHNCPVCNELCINAIEEYNTTNNVQVIKNTLDMNCVNCKHKWINELKDDTSIQDRIDAFLDKVDTVDIERLLRNDFRNCPNKMLRMAGCTQLIERHYTDFTDVGYK